MHNSAKGSSFSLTSATGPPRPSIQCSASVVTRPCTKSGFGRSLERSLTKLTTLEESAFSRSRSSLQKLAASKPLAANGLWEDWLPPAAAGPRPAPEFHRNSSLLSRINDSMSCDPVSLRQVTRSSPESAQTCPTRDSLSPLQPCSTAAKNFPRFF